MLTRWIHLPIEASVHDVGRRSRLRTVLLVLAIAAFTGLAGCASKKGSDQASVRPAVSREVAVAIARSLFEQLVLGEEESLKDYEMTVESSEGQWRVRFDVRGPKYPGSGWEVEISETTGELFMFWDL